MRWCRWRKKNMISFVWLRTWFSRKGSLKEVLERLGMVWNLGGIYLAGIHLTSYKIVFVGPCYFSWLNVPLPLTMYSCQFWKTPCYILLHQTSQLFAVYISGLFAGFKSMQSMLILAQTLICSNTACVVDDIPNLFLQISSTYEIKTTSYNLWNGATCFQTGIWTIYSVLL